MADASLLAHHHTALLPPAAALTELSELRRVVATLQSQLAKLQDDVAAMAQPATVASEATAAASGPAATPSTTPASATSAWGPGGSAWGPRPTASASATAPASPTAPVSGPMTDLFGSIPAGIDLEMTPADGAAPASREALQAEPSEEAAEPRRTPPLSAAASATAADPPESISAMLARLRAEKVERDRLKRAEFLNELFLPELAEEVRRLQRERPDARAHWAAHCTVQSGGVKDPLRHSVASLMEFLSQW